MQSVPSVVGRPPKPSRALKALVGGAGRGGKRSIPGFRDFNLNSTGTYIVPFYTDVVPGRAAALKALAEEQGLIAEAVEGRIEDALATTDVDPQSPLILHLDRASAVASVLRNPKSQSRTVLGYMLIVLPSDRMWGLRFVLEPKDTKAREDAVAFFQGLGEMTERGSSRSILGEGADPSHALAEEPIRNWFSTHCVANLAKAVAGVEPVSGTCEVTTNGQDTRPLFIVTRDAWSDARTLAKEVIANPSSPIRRGIEFVVVEVVPGPEGGIRFHSLRRRKDGRISVQEGACTLDRATFVERARMRAAAEAAQAKAQAEADAAMQRARAEAAEALGVPAPPAQLAELLPPTVAAIERPEPGSAALARLLELTVTALSRAERETVSRSNPVRTTD